MIAKLIGKLFPFTVAVRSADFPDGVIHKTGSYAEALEWMACYSVNDTVAIGRFGRWIACRFPISTTV